MCQSQGNLKEESVVVAILLSCMEVSYCTSGFFRSYARQAVSLSVSCLSRVDLNHTHTYRLSHGELRGYDNVRRSC